MLEIDLQHYKVDWFGNSRLSLYGGKHCEMNTIFKYQYLHLQNGIPAYLIDTYLYNAQNIISVIC